MAGTVPATGSFTRHNSRQESKMADPRDQGYWNATVGETRSFPTLPGDIESDVAIIGGGIVGVTTARLLKDRGQRVALVEARSIGRQVTGKSTAKMSSQHGLRYAKLETKCGADRPLFYAEAQEAGLRRISVLPAEYGIDADIDPRPAYLYTLDEKHVSDLEKEAEVTKRLGL